MNLNFTDKRHIKAKQFHFKFFWFRLLVQNKATNVASYQACFTNRLEITWSFNYDEFFNKTRWSNRWNWKSKLGQQTYTSVLARKWLSSWINENILFTKSAITSECHNIFGWNKKYYFNEWVGQTMSLSILIFWESLWPKFYPIFPQNWAQNAFFPLFSELFLVFFLKHSSKQYRLSKWVIV